MIVRFAARTGDAYRNPGVTVEYVSSVVGRDAHIYETVEKRCHVKRYQLEINDPEDSGEIYIIERFGSVPKHVLSAFVAAWRERGDGPRASRPPPPLTRGQEEQNELSRLLRAIGT